jgi:hypothetical protein
MLFFERWTGELDHTETLDPMRFPWLLCAQKERAYPLSPCSGGTAVALFVVEGCLIVGTPELFVQIREVLVNHGNTIPLRATSNNPTKR